MSDLVNELRQGSLNKDDYRWKAAARIEQLEAALRHYSCTCANEFDGCKARYDMTVCCGWAARAALGEERT